jgi:GT2 family glycosyltransferase
MDFASCCWFAHGSTALLRRDAFARVGPSDPELRRLEDFDWFIRFALMGGRLDVWPHVAAIIEVGSKPPVSSVRAAISRLYAKYVDPGETYRLSLYVINQLRACFDLELASSMWASEQWLPAMFLLGRSLWRVPRTTLRLRRLWTELRSEPLAPSFGPRQNAISARPTPADGTF